MNKYIIITTLCDKEEIANKISDSLLEKKLVTGCQISKVKSKFWWEDKVKEIDEYKIVITTKNSLFNDIKKEIEKIHDYEIPPISCTEMINANEEFFEWIDKYTK